LRKPSGSGLGNPERMPFEALLTPASAVANFNQQKPFIKTHERVRLP
jgi:hypothetical protein